MSSAPDPFVPTGCPPGTETQVYQYITPTLQPYQLLRSRWSAHPSRQIIGGRGVGNFQEPPFTENHTFLLNGKAGITSRTRPMNGITPGARSLKRVRAS